MDDDDAAGDDGGSENAGNDMNDEFGSMSLPKLQPAYLSQNFHHCTSNPQT